MASSYRFFWGRENNFDPVSPFSFAISIGCRHANASRHFIHCKNWILLHPLSSTPYAITDCSETDYRSAWVHALLRIVRHVVQYFFELLKQIYQRLVRAINKAKRV